MGFPLRSLGALSAFVSVVGAAAAMTAMPAGGAVSAAPFSCHGLRVTILGTPEADVLVGTSGDDVIVARGGDDVIRAREGDDVVCAGGGADKLFGGPGDDRLFGQADGLYVFELDHWVSGDLIAPGPGRDRVVGGYDPRQATTGRGPDVLDYSLATQRVVALLAEPGEVGTVTGQGRDRVTGQPQQGIFGSRYDDVLLGFSADEYLSGVQGEDVIRGRGGDDTVDDGWARRQPKVDQDLLSGGPGDDEVIARYGDDLLRGGPGDDFLESPPRCHTMQPGAGHDELWLSASIANAEDTAYTFDAGTGTIRPTPGGEPCGQLGTFEGYHLSADDVMVTFLGSDGPDRLWANARGVTAHLYGGDDEAHGTWTDDYFFSGAGNDTVDADDGYDVCVDTELPTGCESSTAR